MDTARYDICFPAAGEICADYEYALFSALNHEIGDIHNADWLAIHPLRGVFENNRLKLGKYKYSFKIRTDKEHFNTILSLANRKLFINTSPLTLGEPAIFKIKHTENLLCDKISYSGTRNDFEHTITNVLDTYGIKCTINIGKHKTCVIKDDIVHGYQVRLHNLSKEGSLLLQQKGMFGKQRFGFGIFVKYFENVDKS